MSQPIYPIPIIPDCDPHPRIRVWPYAQVIRGAILGDGCSIGSCAIVDGSTLGERVSVGHGAQIHPGIKIGNDVFVGPGAIFCNDMWPEVDKEGFEIPVGSFVTVVEDGASIGAGAIILPGNRIGAGAVIAAGAVVDRDVPAGTLFRRNMPDIHNRIPADRKSRRMKFVE